MFRGRTWSLTFTALMILIYTTGCTMSEPDAPIGIPYLRITNEVLTVQVGDVLKLTYDIPYGGWVPEVRLESSDSTIATVHGRTEVHGESIGTASIKAHLASDPAKFDEVTVTVVARRIFYADDTIRTHRGARTKASGRTFEIFFDGYQENRSAAFTFSGLPEGATFTERRQWKSTLFRIGYNFEFNVRVPSTTPIGTYPIEIDAEFDGQHYSGIMDLIVLPHEPVLFLENFGVATRVSATFTYLGEIPLKSLVVSASCQGTDFSNLQVYFEGEIGDVNPGATVNALLRRVGGYSRVVGDTIACSFEGDASNTHVRTEYRER